MSKLKNKRIFITGGAGYLGSNIVKRYYLDNEITVFSRDEAKHYYLKKRYPKINCVIGDIRNFPLMKKASRNHHLGIYTASLKQIEAVDQNVEEACEIIINGAINSRKCAEVNNFESACFISSDKSRAATTLYGAMKFVAGESFINNSSAYPVKLSCAVYGNVMNSTGSIIPLIIDSIKNKYELTLFSEEMTRFMITIDQAIDIIEEALTHNGYNIIPVSKSFIVKHLFEIYKEQFGLKYKKGIPRPSEKIHEVMISSEEVPRVKKVRDKYYLMHYKDIYNAMTFKNDEYSSRDYVLTKEELNLYLSRFNYFLG